MKSETETEASGYRGKRIDFIVLGVVLLIFAVGLGYPLIRNAQIRAFNARAQDAFGMGPNLKKAADEIMQDLKMRLPDRGFPEPSVVPMLTANLDGLNAGALDSPDSFILQVQYVHLDDLPIFRELAARALARAGVSEIRVRPMQNFLDVGGKRYEQPKWNVSEQKNHFVLKADGEDS